jgi:hypothetical protein
VLPSFADHDRDGESPTPQRHRAKQGRKRVGRALDQECRFGECELREFGEIARLREGREA